MISNCGHDERGKYTGGIPGDQNGDEWAVIPWYNRPWNVVLRFEDPFVAQEISDLARAAAENDNVGYCQGHRGTFWDELKAAGYDPAKITNKCEADCSSGAAAIVKAAGYRLGLSALQKVSVSAYTGNLRSVLKAAGAVELTAKKYLTSDAYLLPGDIALYEGHHVATNLNTGSKAGAYQRVGWQADPGKGWWYAYGWTRGSYHINNAVRIDGKLYFFDEEGYCVRNPYVTTDEKGALERIWGPRVK